MADETITLGGKTWVIPPLPFKVCKRMQSPLIRISEKAIEAVHTKRINAFVDDDIETLACWVWEATQNAEEGDKLTMEEFEALRFSVQDLLGAFPAVARACGLKWGPSKPNGTGESDEGKTSSIGID
jgi:hypothetical protein